MSFLAAPGTWKLNTAKSKFTGIATPKNRTQHWESDGDSAKHHVEGVTGDASEINYDFDGKFDSRDHPIGGRAPGEANSAALKRIDPHTMEVNYKKDGKTVAIARTSVSKDGKVMTNTAATRKRGDRDDEARQGRDAGRNHGNDGLAGAHGARIRQHPGEQRRRED